MEEYADQGAVTLKDSNSTGALSSGYKAHDEEREGIQPKSNGDGLELPIRTTILWSIFKA